MAAVAPSASETFIVVTGGDRVPREVLSSIPATAPVVAADSGIDRALALGLRVTVAVGDFDSVSPDALRAVTVAGAEVERHPSAKDHSDLELALDAAVARGARSIRVLGGDGGRYDHWLGNALLLASAKYGAIELVAEMGTARLTIVRDDAILSGEPGELVSLFALHGPALGVSTDGLLYPLHDEDLTAGASRGISNVLLDHRARVWLRSGVLVAVQPRPLALDR